MNNYAELIEKARGQWPYLLEAAGIEPSFLKNKHGPCPICGGKDRFRFDDKENRGTYFCNQCGAGDGFQLLQLHHKWSPQEAFVFLERQRQGCYEHIGTILKSNKLIKSHLKTRKH